MKRNMPVANSPKTSRGRKSVVKLRHRWRANHAKSTASTMAAPNGMPVPMTTPHVAVPTSWKAPAAL